jgi:hypothetical protein
LSCSGRFPFAQASLFYVWNIVAVATTYFHHFFEALMER